MERKGRVENDSFNGSFVFCCVCGASPSMAEAVSCATSASGCVFWNCVGKCVFGQVFTDGSLSLIAFLKRGERIPTAILNEPFLFFSFLSSSQRKYD